MLIWDATRSATMDSIATWAGTHMRWGEKTPAVLLAQLDPSGTMYGSNAKAFFDPYFTQSIPHAQRVRSHPPLSLT